MYNWRSRTWRHIWQDLRRRDDAQPRELLRPSIKQIMKQITGEGHKPYQFCRCGPNEPKILRFSPTGRSLVILRDQTSAHVGSVSCRHEKSQLQCQTGSIAAATRPRIGKLLIPIYNVGLRCCCCCCCYYCTDWLCGGCTVCKQMWK